MSPADIRLAAEPVLHIGESAARIEDQRLLRGEGCFLDDWQPAGLVHGVVLRSTWAHARIERLDAAHARTLPGVLAILTADDLAAAGIAPLGPHASANMQTGEPFPLDPQPVLAGPRVRHVGEALAFVVAHSHAQALDAMEAIEVAATALPAVIDAQHARAPDAPQLSAAVPGNVVLDWDFGDAPGTRQALAGACHRVSLQVHNHRVVHNPMETRGAIAWVDEAGRYRLRLSSQNVHGIRDKLAASLGIAARDLQLDARDVGGGFGVRNFVYPEYVLTLWAARLLGRPVKWLNSRLESFCSDHQARDFQAEATLGLDAEGRFLGLAIEATFNLGAYLIGAGAAVPTGQYCCAPGSVYAIDRVALSTRAVLTNTVPIGVTRGPGFAEMVDLMERLIDAAARVTGLDRLQLRRRNLVSAARMPWTNAVGTRVDSGDFPACFERALLLADVAGLATRQAAARRHGALRGLGLANHIKATGGLGEENVELRFEDEALVLTTGTQAIGQGHETSLRQIAGSLLGVPAARIRYVAGDTDAIFMGGGHGSSRATYMAGTALHMAAQRIIARAAPLAAALLEAADTDVEFNAGRFVVRGTDRQVTLMAVARAAQARGESLDTYQHFEREAMTYPSGCHVAEVEIDADTGRVRLLRYSVVDDYGVVVNPMLALGQVHGAIAQGVGQALLEEARYDARDGQLLGASFMDYALPRADDLPCFAVELLATPCTTNPLGVKGCGEAGAIAGYPAVANAIADALAGAPGDRLPDDILADATLGGAATPLRLWQRLRERARQDAAR